MKINNERNIDEENEKQLVFGKEQKLRTITDDNKKQQNILKYVGKSIGQERSHTDAFTFQNGTCSDPKNGRRGDFVKGMIENDKKEKELTLFEIYMRKSLRR